jgi:hypothetical protein
MTVRLGDDAIHLEGRCLADDAEHLLLALQAQPLLPVDVERVERLHLAVVQVLLARKPPLRGIVADPFLARYVLGRSYAGNPAL